MRRPPTQKSLEQIEGVLGEPWVRLPDAEALAGWDREDLVAYNQVNRHTEKALFFQRVFDFLTDNRVDGDYFEFGCHRCRTFRMALTEARRHNLSTIRFLAFDSFEGLPEPTSDTTVETWRSGALTTSESEFLRMVDEHGLYVDRVQTVKGFYEQSLTDALQQELLDADRRPMLVNIDCDLYESALPVFRFIDPLLQEGTVIYIDDLFANTKDHRARGSRAPSLEYQETTSWRFQPHMHVGWWGRAYIAFSGDPGEHGI